MESSRRGFLIGATSLVAAAPAIVRASSLMDIKGVLLDPKVLAWKYRIPDPYGNDWSTWMESDLPNLFPYMKIEEDKLNFYYPTGPVLSYDPMGIEYKMVRKSEIKFMSGSRGDQGDILFGRDPIRAFHEPGVGFANYAKEYGARYQAYERSREIGTNFAKEYQHYEYPNES